MNYIRIKEEEAIYPYSLVSLPVDFPQVSFPRELSNDILAEYGIYPVQSSNVPAYDSELQKLEEMDPVEVNGIWTQQWQVVDLNEQEINDKLDEWRMSAICSPLQATIAMYQFGVLSQVEAYMADENTPFIEKVAYQKATEFRRNSPMILQLGQLFQWDEETLDSLFKVAMTIEV